jgi:hypothetical protein
VYVAASACILRGGCLACFWNLRQGLARHSIILGVTVFSCCQYPSCIHPHLLGFLKVIESELGVTAAPYCQYPHLLDFLVYMGFLYILLLCCPPQGACCNDIHHPHHTFIHSTFHPSPAIFKYILLLCCQTKPNMEHAVPSTTSSYFHTLHILCS